MAMNRIAWCKLKQDIARSLYPPKPVYRQCGWRNGHKVYEKVGSKIGNRYVKMRRNPYIRLLLETGDPEKMRRQSRMLRFFRVLRRSTVWWDRPKGLWRGLFGL